jgi:DNA polymerase
MIKLDFEIFSEHNLKKGGAWKHSLHPSTEVLCAAIQFPEEEPILWTPDLDPSESRIVTSSLHDYINDGELFEAHNSFFELCIYENICVKKLGWPPIPRENWRCSASNAAAMALPRALENLGPALNLSKQKDLEDKRVMMKVTKPRKPTKNDPSTRHTPENNPKDFETLYSYCIGDVECEDAIAEVVPPLSKSELEIFQLDQKINLRGVYIDREAVLSALDIFEQSKLKNAIATTKLTSGVLTGTSSPAKVRKWLKNNGLDLPNLQADTVKDTLELGELPHITKKLLELRQQSSLTSIAKYTSMIEMLGDDNRIRGILMYHGASTGRWAGKGFQPHNMPHGFKDNAPAIDLYMLKRDIKLIQAVFGSVNDFLKGCLRGMICAPPGKDLMAGDFAAIEARDLAWLANDENALDNFHNGIDPYIDLAMDIWDIVFDEVTKEKRFVGKHGELGLGYGMGWKKFIMTCAAIAKKMDLNVNVPVPLAKKTVKIYREKHAPIVQFWKDVEAAAVKAVYQNRQVRVDKVMFGMRNNFLHIKLPSGRLLSYYDPKIMKKKTPWGEYRPALTHMGSNATTHKWERQETWGGTLVENITQAVARDCLAEAMLRVEAKGYPIVFHVHDEIVCEIDKGFGGVEEFEEIMSVVPSWAKGCPISVEAWRGKRYRK